MVETKIRELGDYSVDKFYVVRAMARLFGRCILCMLVPSNYPQPSGPLVPSNYPQPSGPLVPSNYPPTVGPKGSEA
jgi:hypothetical protein